MATIKKQGKGYKITVSCGYDAQGRQRREHMTWVPDPGMSEAKIQKELQMQAARFEDKIRSGIVMDSRMKLETFTEKFMEDYAKVYLKPSTWFGYQQLIEPINAALGHIRLCDLKTSHINSFYKNLQEQGMRRTSTAQSKIDLGAYREGEGLSARKLAEMAGVSHGVVIAAERGQKISTESAEKIADAYEVKVGKLFEVYRDMEPLSQRTVLHYHRVLSVILAKAVQWGYINNNPAERAEKPKVKHKESPYLEEDEVRRMLDLLQREPIMWRTVITFDLFSGLRRGELLGLKWGDVDLDSQLLKVERTFNYTPGIGNYEGTTKTDSSQRPMKLSRSAVLLLLEYKAWQDEQRNKLGDAWKNDADRVFTTELGTPIQPSRLTKWFRDFIDRSGLPHVTVHSLRHTYASLLISDGVPLTVVSHQLGHSQTSTTANIYAHVIAAAEAKAQETIDNRFENYVNQAAGE